MNLTRKLKEEAFIFSFHIFILFYFKHVTYNLLTDSQFIDRFLTELHTNDQKPFRYRNRIDSNKSFFMIESLPENEFQTLEYRATLTRHTQLHE